MTSKFVESPQFKLIKEDLKSLGKGLLITLVGAGLTYLSEYVAKSDFGNYTPIVVAVWALVFNTIRKYLGESKYAK